uniref:G-patch domain-containing protein n=1 Tax=Panagrolaimus sp. JU765 TaxID=591449 RepID=A0AC34REJ9_9BILA
MAHLIEPHKFVRFVKASDDLESTKESVKTGSKLDGKEIADFYRSLIGESNHEEPQPSSNVEERLPKKEIQKEPSPISLEPLNDRDQRLWFKFAAENDVKCVKDYLRRGMDIDAKDLWGSTALMCAAATGAEDVVAFLLENGADWQMKSKNGLSASDLARKKGFKEMAKNIEAFGSTTEIVEEHFVESESGYCNICSKHVDGISQHHSSIVHIVNTSKQPREGYAYGIPASNIGYQLLKEKGWSENRGLGKDAVGRKYPLKTTLKRDRKGLGLDKLKQKVTHFEAGDVAAVETVRKEKPQNYFKMLQERKKREKKIEDDFRKAFREYS